MLYNVSKHVKISHESVEVVYQTCGDVMVDPLYRYSGVSNGVALLVLHYAPDSTMHLDRQNIMEKSQGVLLPWI